METFSMNGSSVEEWIQEAEADYKSALDLARRRKEPIPKRVCWDCQQCAEKHLKAFLVRHAKSFPFRHDLTELKTLCDEIDPDFHLIVDDLDELNAYGPDIRYPGSVATVEDARSALTAMKRVWQFVRAKLGVGK
jgi:HEPN domain-containing protein